MRFALALFGSLFAARAALAQEVTLQSDDGSMEEMWSLTSPQAGPADWIGVAYTSPYEYPFRVVRASMFYLDTACCSGSVCFQICGDAGIPDFERAVIASENLVVDPSGLTPELFFPVAEEYSVPFFGAGATATSPPWTLTPQLWELPANTIFDRPGRVFFAMKYFDSDPYMRFAIDATSANAGTSINTSDGFTTRSSIWSFGNVGMHIDVAPLFNIKRATTNPVPSFQLADAQSVTMLAFRISGEQATLVSRVRVTGSGSGNEVSGVTRVRLVVDADDDGVADATETTLGSATFGANDGIADITGLSRNLGNATAEKWLVVYDFSGASVGGHTFSARLAAPSDVSSSIGSPYLSGSIDGPPVTIAGRLVAERGPASSPAVVVAPSATVSPLQLRLRALNESFRISRVTVSAQGSMNEVTGISSVRIHRDADSSGAISTGDTELASSVLTLDDGSVALSFAPVTIAANSSLDLLVSANLTAVPSGGDDFRFMVTLPGHIGADGVVSGPIPSAGPRVLTGLPIIGNTVTIGGALTVGPGAANPPSSTAQPGTSNVPMLQLSLSSAAEAIEVSSLTIQSSGTGDELGDVARARLYRDTNGNGVVDAGDVSIGSAATFGADDGAVTFGFAPELVPQGGTALWLVAFDFTSAPTGGETFRVRVLSSSSMTAEGNASHAPVVASGAFPIQGGIRTLLGGFSVTLATANPPSSRFQPGRIGAPVLAIQLAAQGEDFDVSRLRLSAAGTLDDRGHLLAVKLHRDLGVPGQLDGADVLLASTTFDVDDGAATFAISPAARISGGAVERWLVSYDVATSVASGLTFRARIPTQADLTVAGSLSGPASPSGLPLTSELHSVGGTLVLSAGPQNPAGGSIGPSDVQVPLVQVRAEAVLEPVTVSSVRFRAEGSGNEISDVTIARLFVDVDHDGTVDTLSDVALGSEPFSADDGSVVFTFTPRTIPAGASEDWLLAYDLSGTAVAGSTFAARLALPNDVAASAPSGPIPAASGAPVVGGARLVLGSLELARAPESPAALLAPRGATAVPVFMIDVRGVSEGFVLDRVAFEAAGSVDDPNDVTALHLLLDADHSGTPTAADLTLGAPASFSGDDGVASFDGLGLAIGSARSSLLVVADFATTVESGRNFRLLVRSVSSITATGLGGRVVTDAIGLPISSSPVTIAGTIDLAIGPQPPFPRVVRRGDRGEIALQLRFSALTESATVDRIDLQANGSFDDPAAIDLVELFLDANSNGVVDGGEPRLSSGRFSSNDGGLRLTVGQLVQPSAPITLLARVDVANTPVGGDTFRLSISPADVVISSSSGSVSSAGIGVLGPTLTAGGGLVVSLGSAQAPGVSVNQNEVSVPVLSLSVLADNEPCAVEAITISAAGSIDDAADVSNVRLLRDTNANGLADAFDITMGGASFASDDGSITFSGLQRALGTGVRESWLVAYDLRGSASNLETLRARVLGPSDVVATCTYSGVVEPTGLPIDGPIFTIEEGGALIVSRSTETPASAFVPRGSVRVPALAVRLQARVRAVSVDLMTFTSSSSSQDVVSLVELFRDTNQDGRLDRADRLIASGAPSNGRAALATSGLNIDPSEPTYLLAVATVALDASPGQRFALSIASPSDVPATSALGSIPTILTPITGEAMTVAGDLNISLTTPAGILEVRNDEAGVLAMGVLLRAPSEGFTLSALTLSAAGTADPAHGIQEVRLLADDGDEEPGPSDRPISGGLTFAEGQRRLSVAGLSERIEPSRPLLIFVLVDLNGSLPVDATLSFSIAANVDVTAEGDRVGPSSAVGAPLVGPTLVVGQSLELSEAHSLEARIVGASAHDVVALSLAAAAHNEDVTLTRLTLTMSGSLDDKAGIVRGRLFIDANDNGALDPSDAEVASAQATADDGVLGFAPLGEQIGRGTRRALLVVLDLSGSGSAGQEFRISLASNADVTAFGALSGAVGADGAPIEGPTTTLVGALNVRLGPSSPPAAGQVPGSTFPAFQLEFFSQGEAVTLDQLALRLEGSADDASVIERVSLHRDVDSDGVVGDGDALVSQATPDGDDGRLTFLNLGERLDANAESRLLAVIGLKADAAPGGTLRLSLPTNDELRATGESSGAINAVGAPVSGSEFTIVRPASGSILRKRRR
ncbi:MAG: hypothetical protein HY791_14085 [Deltaproteobacteria bacterium]|nr:hypothetical protein [Deltaproteobacteria bacterium]